MCCVVIHWDEIWLGEESSWEWSWGNKIRKLETRFLAWSSTICKQTFLGLFSHLLNAGVSPPYFKSLCVSYCLCNFLGFSTLGFSGLAVAFPPPLDGDKFNVPMARQHIFVWIMKRAEHGTIVWTHDVVTSPVEKSAVKSERINLGKCHSWTLEVMKAKPSRLCNPFFN